jgi:hypothetical protein
MEMDWYSQIIYTNHGPGLTAPLSQIFLVSVVLNDQCHSPWIASWSLAGISFTVKIGTPLHLHREREASRVRFFSRNT